MPRLAPACAADAARPHSTRARVRTRVIARPSSEAGAALPAIAGVGAPDGTATTTRFQRCTGLRRFCIERVAAALAGHRQPLLTGVGHIASHQAAVRPSSASVQGTTDAVGAATARAALQLTETPFLDRLAPPSSPPTDPHITRRATYASLTAAP